MKKVIIFYLFCLISITKSEAILKTDEGINTQTCSESIMTEYLPKNTKTQSEVTNSTSKMREICPNLDKTCCTYENLDTLKTQLLQGRSKLQSLLTYHDTLIQNFNKLPQKKLQDYLTSSDIEKNKECLGEEFFNNREKFLTFVISNNTIAREKLEASVNKTVKYYSSFACEYCHERIQRAVDIENGQAVRIRQNFFDLKDRFQALIYLADYTNFLFQYSEISRLGSCIKNDKFVDYQELRKIYENLSNIKIGLISCESKDEYKEECMTSLMLSNSFDRIWTYSLVLQYKVQVEEGMKNLGEFLNGGDFDFKPFVGDFDGKVTFYKKREGGLDFDSSLLVISDLDSIQMYHNAMEKDLWGACGMFVSVLTAFMVFFW